ncbi:MAG: Ni,Fe-hydrogenase III large subunit [Myxococcaceae bacterium]|nr:MAG: Ni,Fe-hydrogenase III large subunit [Myxococcaceae bacterium]
MAPASSAVKAVPLLANVRGRRLLAPEREQWSGMAESMKAGGAGLLALWGTDDRDRDGCFRIHAAYLLPDEVVLVEHALPAGSESYPGLGPLFPVAGRLQRSVADLLGLRAEGGDERGWLRHGGWPETFFPLRRDSPATARFARISAPYPFVAVSGDGVHEIPVGPVHAGTIEPGNFRFSVVGEKVLRLEERLGYTHKGVARRFEQLSQSEGQRLAARLSGDSAVAFSWAYCAALEAVTGVAVPPRAAALRALVLERERIANHLGDLGALGNDAGFAFGLAQFSRLKEDLLRANAQALGARYPFDFVVPGGVARDLPAGAPAALTTQLGALETAITELRRIYDDHPGLQDRFREAGRLERELAGTLGALGLAARASGLGRDLRVDQPWPPYDRLAPKLAVRTEGDVAARVQVRFDEVLESIRLCRLLLDGLPDGATGVEVPAAEPDRLGIGLIEGWRGPVLIALHAGPGGAIRRCHPHDPSCQNWPLLEFAILGNIVPDFPLINKSFNLSYSGQDG